MKVNKINLSIDETTLLYTVNEWSWTKDFKPKFETENKTVLFTEAKKIEHQEITNGIGAGILSTYTFDDYQFCTYAWVEKSTNNIFFEWIPILEKKPITKVYWPCPMEFNHPDHLWYTLLNIGQGELIPNNWENELKEIHFDGRFQTAGSYMPWFAQFKERNGYIAICCTPANAGVFADHPANGPFTHVGVWLEASCGKMDYRRVIRYTLIEDGDYNDACKIYRNYTKETGNFCSLEEKAAKVPSVNQLIGSSFVHFGIKTYVRPDSDFYDATNPEKNNVLTTFKERKNQIEKWHEEGAGKLYIHLDGWADPGYDNNHPDYNVACIEAGGWEGFRELVDYLHQAKDMFGIHDQYRDFYFSAESYNKEYATQLVDGSIPTHQRWAGGPQSYLCTTQAPYYVRRNFQVLKENGIHLDGAYLDVFTCNEADECNNPLHKMTREESLKYRGNCFNYLLANGILSSSEEVSDWSMRSLVFCHYAPYSFMLKKPGSPRIGVPVPLFNLVYHDCLVIPWMMDKVSEKDDYMLYALLNGGAPYLLRLGAYPNTDGSFEDGVEFTHEQMIARSKVVAELHQKIAKQEMIRHEFVDYNYQVQKTTFADGTTVLIDFDHQTYTINGD